MNNNTIEKLRKAVNIVIKTKNLKLIDVADAAGISVPYLSQILNGKKELTLNVVLSTGLSLKEIASIAEADFFFKKAIPQKGYSNPFYLETENDKQKSSTSITFHEIYCGKPILINLYGWKEGKLCTLASIETTKDYAKKRVMDLEVYGLDLRNKPTTKTVPSEAEILKITGVAGVAGIDGNGKPTHCQIIIEKKENGYELLVKSIPLRDMDIDDIKNIININANILYLSKNNNGKIWDIMESTDSKAIKMLLEKEIKRRGFDSWEEFGKSGVNKFGKFDTELEYAKYINQ